MNEFIYFGHKTKDVNIENKGKVSKKKAVGWSTCRHLFASRTLQIESWLFWLAEGRRRRLEKYAHILIGPTRRLVINFEMPALMPMQIIACPLYESKVEGTGVMDGCVWLPCGRLQSRRRHTTCDRDLSLAVACTVFSFILATARLLEGTAQPTIHSLLTTMSTEALLTFSNPHNPSGVPRRERIPPSANRMEANGGRVLKCKNSEKWPKYPCTC